MTFLVQRDRPRDNLGGPLHIEGHPWDVPANRRSQREDTDSLVDSPKDRIRGTERGEQAKPRKDVSEAERPVPERGLELLPDR